MVLAPEHELVKSITTSNQEKAVAAYIEEAAKKKRPRKNRPRKKQDRRFYGSLCNQSIDGTKNPRLDFGLYFNLLRHGSNYGSTRP